MTDMNQRIRELANRGRTPIPAHLFGPPRDEETDPEDDDGPDQRPAA